MDKKQILVVCTHPDILQTIARLIDNNPDWTCITAAGCNEAKARLTAGGIDLVLLGSGIEPAEEENLTAFCRLQQPTITIVQHFGGGSGLLSAEIYSGLGHK